MIIDFHTHIFPDKIASKTIEYLSKKGGIPPFSDGSVSGLLKRMEEANADAAVALPVLTNPDSFRSVNEFAEKINLEHGHDKRKIISFGAIHPRLEDIEGKMKLLKEMGFKGVKIHPDYQGAYINDDGYVRILKCAAEYDMIVVTHAGLDGAYPNDVHCTPSLVLDLIKKAPHKKLVLAHLGSLNFYDEVINRLSDADVYFDTAYVLKSVGKETFDKILRSHGEDRILFASDSPWSDIKNDIDILRGYVQDEEALNKILYKNAKKLLEI